MTDTKRLSAWLRDARRAIAFTGAGMSTESGISDFRSPGGVWSRHQPVYFGDFVESRAARVRYWRHRRAMYAEIAGARPNAGHVALARLEAEGRLRGVITQNIDGLHQDAGSRSVIEIHGTSRIIACIACGKECAPEAVEARLDAGEDAPDCEDCGAPLKSKTISFGQAMPEREMAAAAALAIESDVFLSIGSSLVVEPAASLPRLAGEAGAMLVIINNAPTPLDALATLVIREPIGEVLSEVITQLGYGDTA
jgi:NAD-dependent deacetylase